MQKQSGNIILIILFWFSGFTIVAQQNIFYYPNSTTVPGLPSKITYSVFKDSKGFMWFGTETGLYRWDGIDYKIFRYDPDDSTSISGNMIDKILMEDNEGNMWISARESGLNIYNPSTESFTRFSRSPDYLFDFDFNRIHVALQDKNGEVWLAGRYIFGVINFDKTTGSLAIYRVNPDTMDSEANMTSSMYEDESGILWIGTLQGLYQFNRDTKTFTNFESIVNADDELNYKFISGFIEDENSVLWMGSYAGLYKYDSRENRVNYFKYENSPPNNNFSAFLGEIYYNPSSDKNSIWIITAQSQGIKKFDKITEEITYFNKNLNDIKRPSFSAMINVLFDEGPIIWAASKFGGIRYNLKINPFTEFTIGPFGKSPYLYAATDFVEDSDGNIWVGTAAAGLLKYDQDMNLLEIFYREQGNQNSIKMNYVYSLYEDKDNLLWVGLGNGLDLFDQINNRFIHCTLPTETNWDYIRINNIFQDSYETIWIAARSGLYYLKKKNLLDSVFLKIPELSGKSNEIKCSKEDNLGNVWFGSNGTGLYVLTPENRKSMTLINFKHDPEEISSISDDVINSIYFDNDHLWFGTPNGLNRLDPKSDQFYRFNQKNGLDAYFIYDIEGDGNGALWLSTEKGIMRFKQLSDTSAHSKLLKTAEGVPFEDNYQYNIYKDKKGKIFVGGQRYSGKSFYCFHPDSLKENKHVPEIVLTEFLVNNKPYGIDSSITELKKLKLNYNENFFSFNFAALDYVNPLKNEYAYMLEGFDESWTFCGNDRQVKYTNVPAGSYFFRVKGSNNDGLWNEEGTTLMITISPPPWKTWWAYLLYVIFILTILYFVIRYYFKRQQLLHKLALEQVQTEKLEELDRTKSRFFANISHEFRTPLTLILGPMEKLRTQISDGARKDLDMMQRNAKRLQKLINQLLSLSKLESGKMKLHAGEVNIVLLVKRYSQSFESLAKQKKIEYQFKSSEENFQLFVDKDKIEKILYNLLSNAFKFTGEGGKIVVDIAPFNPPSKGDISESLLSPLEGGRGVNISISNTGKGIPPEKLPHIFDRFYQVDDNYSRDQEGTGIGLALAKELVELHHGKISVESKLKEGTTFTVLLPVGKEHLKPVEMVQVIESVNSEDPPDQMAEMQNQETINDDDTEKDNTKPLILIVEDNDDLRSYVRSYLTDDYLITEAIDGEMGLNKAIDKIPDLIVSDVMMPKMDGYGLCEKVKSDERTSHIPVILLTAKAAREDKLEGLETGADDFLTKPFDSDELLVRIRNLIQQRRKWKEIILKNIGSVNQLSTSGITSMDQKFLKKAVEVVEKHISDSEFSVELFGQEMAMSRVQLHRKLTALVEQSSSEFIRTIRLNKAAIFLKKKSGNIAEIAYGVGFSNPSYFSDCFRKQFGKLPSEYVD